MTAAQPSLLCRCGEPLTLREAGGRCSACGAVIPIDDVGIIRLTCADEPWDDVPAYVASATSEANDAGDLVDRMTADGGWPVALQRQLLHPAAGVAAVLVEPTVTSPAALDLGTGWGPLAAAARLYGTTTVRADWTYSRLRFNVLMHGAAETIAVHVDPDAALPWPPASFDLVFVDAGELERVKGAAHQARLLREVSRILKPDGIAVVGTRNPLVHRAHAAAAGGPQAADTARLGKALWHFLVSPWGRRSLRRAGLAPARVVVPYPSRKRLLWLTPESGVRARLRETARHPGLRNRVLRILLASGASMRLVPDYFVLARSDGSDTATPMITLAEHLVGAPPGEPPVTVTLSDARVAIVGQREFVKLPLSAEQEVALTTEVTKTEQARHTAFAPFVIPGSAVKQRRVSYSTYPRIVERPPPAAARHDAVARVLDALDASRSSPLNTTTCWYRLTSDRGEADARETGALDLREAVLARCGEAVVPIGPSHGDLHADNIMLSASGEALLVDWNRFEACNPLVLDAAYAAMQEHCSATGVALATATARFATGDLPGRLYERAIALTGELDRWHVAAIVVLDRIVSYSLPRRRYKPWTVRTLQGAVEALRQHHPG